MNKNISIILVLSLVFQSSYSYITLRDLATGLCLESNANKGVFTNDCSVSSYQKWIVNPNEKIIIAGEEFTDLKNSPTGLCLDSDLSSKKVFANACNNLETQKWTIQNQEVRNQNGLCLESDSSNKAFLAICNNNNFQKWL